MPLPDGFVEVTDLAERQWLMAHMAVPESPEYNPVLGEAVTRYVWPDAEPEEWRYWEWYHYPNCKWIKRRLTPA